VSFHESFSIVQESNPRASRRCHWSSVVAFLANVLLMACDGQITTPALPIQDRADALRPAEEVFKLKLADFTSEQTCSGCHPRQAAEWKLSSHSHAMGDPVFQALVARASAEAPESRAFCLSCHSNIGTAAGSVGDDLSFDTFDPLVMEGVSCESCHRITEVLRPSNAGHVLNPNLPIQGSVHAGNKSPYHETDRSAVLGTAEFCASCHDVYNAGGLALEQPYVEWSSAPAKEDGLICIDCHMPKGYGLAAQGFGLTERPVRRHSFLGPGALTPRSDRDTGDRSDLEAEVVAQMRQSISIELDTPEAALPNTEVSLHVAVQSHVPGHRFPTGSVFFRQLWLSVRALDAGERLIFETPDPTLEADDSAQSAQLLLSGALFDASDAPTLFPWQAKRMTNGALLPLERRQIEIAFVLPAEVQGPVHVQVQLQFRTFSEALLNELALAPELGSTLQLGEASADIEIAEVP
jgi:cytochrome c554/c'-like protein